eukprot:202190_1
MATSTTSSVKEHRTVRSSKYALVPIPKAVNIILNEIESATSIGYARLNECGSRILAKDIYAPINLPRCNTSIMDGYAMNYALNFNESSIGSQLGVYKVVNVTTAGNESKARQLSKGEVAYVTTGSALPSNTDCVVQVEQTEIIDDETVKLLSPPSAPLQFVRTQGSDIKKGQLLLSKGTKLQSSELGILASCGSIMIPVYNKIRVTILSTGDELKDPFTFTPKYDENKQSETPTTNLIFDSNKVMLTQVIHESCPNLCVVKDGGIATDDCDALKQHILELLPETDILITSGGVSMGSRDYIKPILEEIGELKIGRICIKPGKPTTFGTVMVADKASGDMKKKLMFGLPGNPVSAQVCFKMFVEPAIRKSTGIMSHFNCQHPPINVEITQDIRMDPERPNYNRCTVYWDKAKGKFVGYQNGSQRSSRLLSCKSANCLLRIPQKSGVLTKGSMVKALVIGPLIPNMPPALDDVDAGDEKHDHLMDCACGKKHSHGGHTGHKSHNEQTLNAKDIQKVNIGVLTVSDRASKGVYSDESGPALGDGLKELFGEKSIDKMEMKIVPDDVDAIEACLKQWEVSCDLIITTGGTGLTPRDHTPDVTKKFIKKECNGIVFKMMQYGLQQTEFACLSRYVAGVTENNCLIINMPGSVKAVKQCLHSIKKILPHAINQINQKAD